MRAIAAFFKGVLSLAAEPWKRGAARISDSFSKSFINGLVEIPLFLLFLPLEILISFLFVLLYVFLVFAATVFFSALWVIKLPFCLLFLHRFPRLFG